MDIAAFRAAFPEFRDIAVYTDGSINFWAEFATAQINARRWRSQVKMGIYLYVAHEITLAAKDQKAANIGGSPGQTAGPVNSKTVGPVTVAYDTTQGFELGAGYFNLTSYGKQLFRLARTFGAGCVQL